ncbi:hypothetical protein KIW84_030841 [Lathyrus oleraceus]|nr:hypothetical protein KIW84_030841 [Pisum sativum]
MRLWGHNLEVLRIASGTIFNEIVVWKVASPHDKSSTTPEDHEHRGSNCSSPKDNLYESVHVCKLVGHEGSIFRIAWSSCGSKLLSVSDDRSARVWTIPIEREDSLYHDPIALVLFGHNARVWDCCISDDFIVTVSEDCTCRIWGIDGEQLQVIREHIGRGIWRCLYEPKLSLLITAGFDSAIKVHRPPAFLSGGLAEAQLSHGRTEMFSICIPHVLQHIGLTDRVLFMLLPIMVISTMLNYVKLEVLIGISLFRSATGLQLSVWIYCPRTHLNLDVVMKIGSPLEMVKEI